jgi:hypothetical protein
MSLWMESTFLLTLSSFAKRGSCPTAESSPGVGFGSALRLQLIQTHESSWIEDLVKAGTVVRLPSEDATAVGEVADL